MAAPDFPYFFDFKRATQAAGYLLKLEGRRMNYMRLLKLLYLADRESLKETGDSITGDTPYAMERGPVLTQIYDYLKGKHPDSPRWREHIETKRYDAQLVKDPGTGSLSRYDIDKLKEISDRYQMQDEWEMVNICHDLEEWKKNDPGTSARAIPFQDILVAIGREQDADKIRQEATNYSELESRLAKVQGQ